MASNRESFALRAPRTLRQRYQPKDLAVFTPDEYRRFLGSVDQETLARVHDDPRAWEEVAAEVSWELLYRIEPELYARMIAGEQLHPGILSWIPPVIRRAVDVGAGLGRLTLELALRCHEGIAVEPAAPLRHGLESRLRALGHDNVSVRNGFFDELPLPSSWADATFTCSAFTCDPVHGGDAGIAELERVTCPGGLVVIVWPPRDRGWLAQRGYEWVEFPGELVAEFPTLEEALEIASIFYPNAVKGIAEAGSPLVPYELLGMNGPRSLAWRRVEA